MAKLTPLPRKKLAVAAASPKRITDASGFEKQADYRLGLYIAF